MICLDATAMFNSLHVIDKEDRREWETLVEFVDKFQQWGMTIGKSSNGTSRHWNPQPKWFFMPDGELHWCVRSSSDEKCHGGKQTFRNYVRGGNAAPTDKSVSSIFGQSLDWQGGLGIKGSQMDLAIGGRGPLPTSAWTVVGKPSFSFYPMESENGHLRAMGAARLIHQSFYSSFLCNPTCFFCFGGNKTERPPFGLPAGGFSLRDEERLPFVEEHWSRSVKRSTFWLNIFFFENALVHVITLKRFFFYRPGP